MPWSAEESVINLPPSDYVIAGSTDDATVADFGLDDFGLTEAIVGIEFLRLDDDEGLNCCGLASQRACAA